MTLARVLALGGLYDLLFGVAIVVFTRPAAELLGIRVPDEPVYLYLNGVFLLILGAVYIAASRDPERYPAVPPIAAVGRLLGCFLFAWVWRGGGPPAFLSLGLGDLALGIVTFAAWRRARLK